MKVALLPRKPRGSSDANVLARFTGEKTTGSVQNHPETASWSVSLQFFSLLYIYTQQWAPVTWQSPALLPQQVPVSQTHLAGNAPPRGCAAPVRMRVESSRRRNRSSRIPAGCGGRLQASGPALWSGAGPAVPCQWRWWHWCVKPSAHSCMCYCRCGLSFWSPGPKSAGSRTFWSQLGPYSWKHKHTSKWIHILCV